MCKSAKSNDNFGWYADFLPWGFLYYIFARALRKISPIDSVGWMFCLSFKSGGILELYFIDQITCEAVECWITHAYLLAFIIQRALIAAAKNLNSKLEHFIRVIGISYDLRIKTLKLWNALKLKQGFHHDNDTTMRLGLHQAGKNKTTGCPDGQRQ